MGVEPTVLYGQLHPTLEQLYRLDERCDDGDTQFEYAVGHTGRPLIITRHDRTMLRITGVGQVVVEELEPIPDGMQPSIIHCERLLGDWFVSILLRAAVPRRSITYGEAPFCPEDVWRRP